MAECRTPLIVAVSGWALGGGFELALTCDLIVASETAEFGQPEITLGIIPGGGGTQRLARAIGKQRAMEFVLTGRRFDALEAERMGLVNEVAKKKAWLDEALELARRIASRPPLAARLGKQAVLVAEEPASPRGSSRSDACTSWRWRPRTASRACRPSSRSASRTIADGEAEAKPKPRCAAVEARSVIERVGVVGAGTMGAGIAQMACLAGCETYLHDPVAEALERGAERLRADLDRGAERERWSAADAAAAANRLRPATGLDDLAGCELVVEAAPEQLDIKRELFGALEGICADDAVLATNTSSIPVTQIAAGATHPERICGMHFFNPPALMRLVEVVAGESTGEPALDATSELAERMGRTPVRCADAPGFIVNRCNRPFALESLQMLGEGIATHAQIDRIVREDGGYRMGPFELMDLIGIDTNLSVARSFYAQRAEPRWQPHAIQERLVAEGRLGRKSGSGFYEYADGKKVEVESEVDDALRDAVLDRLLAQLINEASFAVEEGVAEPKDIDIAMKLGLNHPKGPFEWLDQIGSDRVLATLTSLSETHDPARYRPSNFLASR